MFFILALLAFEAVLAALLFGSAGRLDLPWFWALLAIHASLVFVGGLLMDPALRRERLRPGPGARDPYFRAIVTPLVLLQLVIAGLDAGRYHWSAPVPTSLHAAGLVAYTVGLVLCIWAMTSNPFFSSVIRLQTDRGHHLVTAGPYRHLRHPGYAGMLLCLLAEAFVFGSYWALLAVLPACAVIVARTLREDRFLHGNLAGYPEYAHAVRSRLAPAVW